MKKTASIIFFTFFIVKLLNGQVIKNNYLAAFGESSSGRIFVKTVEGNPKINGDENLSVTNGKATPFSSFITVLVDNKTYNIGPGTKFITKIKKIEDALVMTALLPNKIEVNQIVKFIKNSDTGRNDMSIIAINVKNRDDKAHNVKIRYVIDTDAETNRNFAFKLINGKTLSSEANFVNRKIPSKIILVDNKNNPLLKLQYKFSYSSSIKPYRVMLAGYNKFKNSKFEFKTKKGASFAAGSARIDAAIGTYYNLGRMIPDNVKSIAVLMGLLPKVSSRLAGFISELEVANQVKKPPLNIQCTFKNIGRQKFKIVKAILIYPRFLKFTDNINQIQAHRNVRPGRSITFKWKFTYPKNKFQKIKIYVKIKAYNEDMKLKVQLHKASVFLTAGRNLSQSQRQLSSLKVSQLLDQLILLRQTESLMNDELEEIDFLIEKINTATNMNAYIAGRRTISTGLLKKIKTKMEDLLYKIEKRKKKLQEMERQYNSATQSNSNQ